MRHRFTDELFCALWHFLEITSSPHCFLNTGTRQQCTFLFPWLEKILHTQIKGSNFKVQSDYSYKDYLDLLLSTLPNRYTAKMIHHIVRNMRSMLNLRSSQTYVKQAEMFVNQLGHFYLFTLNSVDFCVLMEVCINAPTTLFFVTLTNNGVMKENRFYTTQC